MQYENRGYHRASRPGPISRSGNRSGLPAAFHVTLNDVPLHAGRILWERDTGAGAMFTLATELANTRVATLFSAQDASSW
jgi:hypothetical protein